jgi:hypothetical protein
LLKAKNSENKIIIKNALENKKSNENWMNISLWLNKKKRIHSTAQFLHC